MDWAQVQDLAILSFLEEGGEYGGQGLRQSQTGRGHQSQQPQPKQQQEPAQKKQEQLLMRQLAGRAVGSLRGGGDIYVAAAAYV